MSKRITILGSTGSIGTSTIDAVQALGDEYTVVGLGARRSWEDLAEQCKQLKPSAVAVADSESADKLRSLLNGDTELFVGPEGLVKLAVRADTDYIVASIVGAAGLDSTIAAVRAGKDVGLANKEALVVAGSIIVPLAAETGTKLLPIDSEHSAIFQALTAGHADEVRKIYLTASGGPFRTWSPDDIAKAGVKEALNHPTWSMGPKITIDSATMMNKALEIIEAKWLFDVDADSIEVLIHPESIIHSMVEYVDGSVIAQLGTPDMKTPIQYALTYPDRREGCANRIDFSTLKRLNFEQPDFKRFPALRIGFEVARTGGTSGAVFNAANEAAVDAFLNERIPFGKIVELIERTLGKHDVVSNPDLETLLEADAWARREVAECLNQ